MYIEGIEPIMKNMEIEKKYTIKKLPENLETYPCKIIEQAYLNTAPVALRLHLSSY